MPRTAQNIGQDANAELGRLLTTILRPLPEKRPQIAERLGNRLGQRVTVHMLNDFTSEGKKSARFPAAFIAAFCEVTGDDRLQRFVLSQRQRDMLTLGEFVWSLLDERTRKLLLAESRKRRR